MLSKEAHEEWLEYYEEKRRGRPKWKVRVINRTVFRFVLSYKPGFCSTNNPGDGDFCLKFAESSEFQDVASWTAILNEEFEADLTLVHAEQVELIIGFIHREEDGVLLATQESMWMAAPCLIEIHPTAETGVFLLRAYGPKTNPLRQKKKEFYSQSIDAAGVSFE
jgi:hypothetical protein